MKISDSSVVPIIQALDHKSSLPLPDISAAGNTQPIPQNPEEMRKAAKQYEAFFISYLLKVMRETVHETGMTGKDAQYFYSFYDQEISNRAAEAGGIGIAKMVESYIEKNFTPPPQVQPPGNR